MLLLFIGIHKARDTVTFIARDNQYDEGGGGDEETKTKEPVLEKG